MSSAPRLLLACAFVGVVVVAVSAKRGGGGKASPPKAEPRAPTPDDDNGIDETVEAVDEDKIDELIGDAERNLAILFYEGRGKCPRCTDALAQLEQIDEQLEADGFIEVVKSEDRNVARELGVLTFPALVYVRRRNPILYDGDFKDAQELLRWIRAHDEVATVHLNDDDFEEHTDSASPADGALDWFIMFYNSKDEACGAHVAAWEAVAHKLRGLSHVGKVDVADSDDVGHRFKIDDEDDCPTFILMHKGKMYRYKDSASDVRGLVAFATRKFKEQRGHRVPEPPSKMHAFLLARGDTDMRFREELFEEFKENLIEIAEPHKFEICAIGSVLAFVCLTVAVVCAIRRRRAKGDKKAD